MTNATLEQFTIGAPLVDNHGKTGFVAAISEKRSNVFMIGGNGMQPVTADILIVWDNDTASEIPDTMAAGWVERAASYNIEPCDNVGALLSKARQKEAERYDTAKAERLQKEADLKAFREEARGKVPAWAKSAIIAELIEDDSDSMTDYFNSKTKKTVILGFSKHDRDIFSEMRKFARHFPETVHLADAPDSADNRQKYSMGGGYFLKMGGQHHSGWKVSKLKAYGGELSQRLPLSEWALEAPTPTPTHASTQPAIQAGAMRIEQHTHTRKGFEMFLCIMADRVGRSEYLALLDSAKALNGWYSRPFGKTPGGFAFKSMEDAQTFAGGTPEAATHETPDYLALDSEGHEYKRPAQTVGELPHADIGQALQDIADAQGIGPIAFGVKVYVSMGLTPNQAKADPREWILKSGDDLPLTLRTKPTPPRQPAPGLADKLRTMADGLQKDIDNKMGDRLTNTPKRQREAASARQDGRKFQRAQAAMRALASLHDAGDVPSALAYVKTKSEIVELCASRINRENSGYYHAGIDTDTPAIDSPAAHALWALLTGPTEAEQQAEQLKVKLDALQFAKIPGYFPTPVAVIETMIDAANVPTGQAVRILEPEAGGGAILDALRDCFPLADLVAFEVWQSLRDILALKGYPAEKIGRDFMEVDPAMIAQVDFAIMNPPFESGQDMAHVQHAFSMLKPGGRLVAIMSPGPFFRSDRKAVAFRDWFDDMAGEKIDLPANAFKESGTSVATVMVTIDKGEG